MGFTLRYNIFGPDAREQRTFQRYPIQVVVLFSPTDIDFSETLRELFLHLDQLTGEQVVFFAVLDPPDRWLKVATERSEWREHQGTARRLGFSLDDKVLVHEIARLFGVSWSSLPALAVGTNLWSGDLLITPTKPWKIERQLVALTDLARETVEPNVDQIAVTIEDAIGLPIEKVKAQHRGAHRLRHLYEFLNTLRANRLTFDARRFNRLLDDELASIERMFSLFRRSDDGRSRDLVDKNLSESFSGSRDEAFEAVAEEARGALVAPSTVAMKVMRGLREAQNMDSVHALDEESRIMIETALRHGHLLEHRYKQSEDKSEFFSLPRPNNPSTFRGHSYPREDFTPGAQGIWKALELEVNLSVIQAARTSRGVKMPEYFTYHDPTLPKEKGRVLPIGRKGKPRFINTPVFDSQMPKKHRFLPLGDAYYVAEAMLFRQQEDLDRVIRSCLGGPLPDELLKGWKEISRIRNPVSHTRALCHDEYLSVLETFFDGRLLEPLVRIKKRMSNRNST